MHNYRIVFVTYSVSLIYNWVTKLMPHLSECEVLVFHIRNLESIEQSKVLPVKNVDISRLSYKQIMKIIKDFNPSICVFFNFRSIMEQMFLRICKAQNIKTFYLEHGIITKDAMTFKKFRLSNLPNRIKRVYIQLRQYFAYIMLSPNKRHELYIMYEVLMHNYFSLSPFDYYGVFGQRCLNFLKAIFKIDENKNAFIVGYPLFDTEEQAKEAMQKDEKYKNRIIYIHQPFILDHYTSITYDEERQFVLKWADKLVSTDEEFTILLHPRENLEHYYNLYKNTKINIIQSPNNYQVFKQASLVLGHYSTALLYPLYLNIPTYLIDYPQIELQPIFKNIFPHLSLNDNIKQSAIYKYQHKSFLIGTHNTFEYIANEIQRI